MKKLLSHRGITLPTVHLYRNDIENVLSALNNPILKYNNYECDNLDEIQSNYGDKINSIEITARNPYISLRIGGNTMNSSGNWLYIDKEDDVSLSAFFKIKEILLSRKSILPILFSPFVGISAYVLLLAPMILPNKIINLFLHTGFERILFAFVLLIIMFSSFFFNNGFFSSITLLKRHEHKNFFSRNQDQILLVIIGWILGLISYKLFGH